MKKRNHARFSDGTAGDRPTPWLYIFLTILCSAFLATGFFFAARQHFASMDLGMKNSKLRKQIEAMETQNRQLTLSREVATSPMEMKRNAVSRGFRERDAIATFAATTETTPKTLVERTAITAPANTKSDVKPIKAFLPVASKPVVTAEKAAAAKPRTKAKSPTA
jgi:hypothetical protein